MRHRNRGRRLGRSSSHRRAMLRNLASSLFLTERDAELDENKPAVKGRIVTTLHKAKEVRPLIEKCITIARRALPHAAQAEQFESNADRNSESWKTWRNSPQWQQWAAARAPVVAARRQALKLLGDKQAVAVLFEEIAPRFESRDGGYTRIMRLAKPRLGDAGTRAILEFVGENDRVKKRSQRPAFAAEPEAQEDEQVSSETKAEAQEEAQDEGQETIAQSEQSPKE